MKTLYDGKEIEYDDEFSHRDFTQQTVKIPNDIIVYSSCFSQEVPDSNVFPEKMTGVTFIDCNLDNCFIPTGNTAINCAQRKFEKQNDLRDWEVDEKGNPTKILSEEYWKKYNYSVDPKDIPTEPYENLEEIKKV